MFPNGRWRGWWEQGLLGRHWMDPLELHSQGNRILGEGQDVVGPFTFNGSRDATGMVRLEKQYLNQHAVSYVGRFEGEGVIVGYWNIANLGSGRFALIPSSELARDMPIAEIS